MTNMLIAARLVKLLIRAYQLMLSPMLGVNCRFTPSCSHYAAQAVDTHGVGKGSYLACKRLLRCHPFAKAGYDPIPPAEIPPEQLMKPKSEIHAQS